MITYIVTGLISIIIAIVAFIVLRLKNPYIIRADDKTSFVRSKDTALFAASFNPIHKGHVAILRRIARRHNRVYCVIGFNPKKKYPVSPQERKRLVEKVVKSEADLRDRVQVVMVRGYIWKWASESNVSIMYRGIRSWEKDGAEETYLHFQNLLGPILLARAMPPETRFVESENQFIEISSSRVRKAAVENDISIENDVPSVILSDIKSLWKV
jgi:pantetheine-phosphate adenylyltransferase